MTDLDYDPVYDRLDAMAGDEPTEPNCFECYDGRSPGTSCRSCNPTPRERRRAAHRGWQRRDRASRAAPARVSDFDSVAPF